MAGLIVTLVIMIIIFSLLGWAVRFKQAYYLISGFNTMSEDEQRQLIQNGYPQKVGSLLICTAIGTLVLLPLLFTPFPYAFEVIFGFILLFLLGGFVYLSRYELKHKRKKGYIISISLLIIVVGGVALLMTFTYQDYEVILENKKMEITGMYGQQWPIDELKSVELLDEMPEIGFKTNGVGVGTLAKGHFNVKGYGNSLLYIFTDSNPIILIETSKKPIFLNNQSPTVTEDWFNKLRKYLQ
ncbi:DUF3784 domain-containing protein [Bacillus mesophilum]|uniref:DUF3784 domain-containing protein n=1 Tax=Bacillus mesophilum TaxID=1071718 RepID=A0A7V7RKL2_9BACI|nr:DUF3784 domain-containing protein [Bacillus mesophilum]KAB2331857.1 DUF3784 domain-containing protein [Bacillus mesophilum]